MNIFQTSKVEYKITSSIKGTCPLCNEPIDIEKVEELSDDVPSREYYETCHELFRKDVDAYLKYEHDNPTFINLHNLCETWRDRVEELPIRSLIKSEAIYVLSGHCPYCGTRIDLRMPFTIMHHAPPKISPGEEREIHTFEKCPSCGNQIHITDGRFYTESGCPDHMADKDVSTTGGTGSKPKGRKGMTPPDEPKKELSHKELLKNTCKECGTVYIETGKECPVCALKKKLAELEKQQKENAEV